MASFKVKVTQVFRVERSIIVDVDAVDEADAIESVSTENAPDYDDAGWTVSRTLENEEYELCL